MLTLDEALASACVLTNCLFDFTAQIPHLNCSRSSIMVLAPPARGSLPTHMFGRRSEAQHLNVSVRIWKCLV